MSEKILITGGAGFIGSEFIRLLLKKKYQDITVVDKLAYSGDLYRLQAIHSVKFYKADICSIRQIEKIFKTIRPDIVVHFAAETHVDRSLLDQQPFITTNVEGTKNLINASLIFSIKKFIHISTDEVYGSHKSGFFKETDSLKPHNPYAKSKAEAELLIQKAVVNNQFPAIIVRPSNTFGPFQYPEKLFPVVIYNALKNQNIPVYDKGRQIREWMYVSDCCEAIYLLMRKGKIGGIYNIGSGFESKNLDTVKAILKILRKEESLIHFIKDRPHHDFRYSLNCQKIQDLGWKPKVDFLTGIEWTVDWYVDNNRWLFEKVKKIKKYWEKIYIEK